MTHKFDEIKETYTDEMKLTGTDVLNVVSHGNTPTLRLAIDRNCIVQSQATQNGIIKSNLIDIYKDIPEADMTEDFYRGYSVASIVLNSALHNWFMDQYGVEVEDIDIIFKVENHHPTFHIDVAEDKDDGDDNSVEPSPPKFDKEIKKIKEDIENN